MLTNFKIWYGLRENEISELEEVDKLILRRIKGAPDSTGIESLYLELGVTPITCTMYLSIAASRFPRRACYLLG